VITVRIYRGHLKYGGEGLSSDDLMSIRQVTPYDQAEIHLEIIGKSSDSLIEPIDSFGDFCGQSDSGHEIR
jgi:hypothetical protein